MHLKVIYITFSRRKSARKFARALLKKNLIACANIYKIDSLYKWKGEIASDKEFVLWAKSTENNLPEIEKFVEEEHDYDTPCIANFNFEANKPYAQWVQDECQ